MNGPKKFHHLAVRLTEAQYVMLERLRAAMGMRSFNATFGHMVDEWGKDLDSGNVVTEPPKHIQQIHGD